MLDFCIVNSAPVQSVRVYNDLMGQRTNTAKLNRLLYNMEDIWDNPTLVVWSYMYPGGGYSSMIWVGDVPLRLEK